MNWARILAYVTGTVDQELLARNEYLVTENPVPRREVALLPGVIIRLPRRRQPRDDGRRQVRGVLAQESGERLLEVAG